MKNQLLEDIGANDSAPNGNPRARLAGRRPATPPPDPAPRPKVWRERQNASAEETRAPRQERPPEPPPEPPPSPFTASPSFSADFSSFASQEPDLSIQLPEEPVPWTERWGRKLLGWSIATAAVAAIVGAGWWIYGDTQVESTLALVADQSPAPTTPAPVLPAAPSTSAPVASAPVSNAPALSGPAVSDPALSGPVPAAPTVAAPANEMATAPQPAAASLDAGEEAIAGAAGAAGAAVVAAAARKAVGDPAPPAPRSAPVKKTPRPAARPAQPPARRELAAVRTAPRVVAERPAPPPAAPAVQDSLEETLRQCRAAGYHASMCLKRGCTATKFGLACRG
ncbi:hypothetical protein B0920_05435 [Massilia sp. KIM]|uniref:hypothetical protein n=1 Tax=Massilia sp. KIM TaxID=1955422 RepID=UPI00098F84D5|nr:hypothetical protein [Massilia sp. KIM]OON62875.1 hypothetical protein B0920_05435 [Massilia sp. KIM]